VVEVADRLHLVVRSSGTIYDALWDLETPLLETERDLLATPAVSRLHGVVHAGASALTTAQTYSRLEHTLGVFSLAAHFAPDDRELRAASLLHDVGHLPLSHTLEGIGGLDHHAVGHTQIASSAVADVLQAGGLDAVAVAETAFGLRPTLLRPGRGRLGLDHLDSFVRAGRVHGWLRIQPPDILDALYVAAGELDGSPAAGDELARLMVNTARFHAHPLNVGPTALVRRAFRRLIAADPDAADKLTAATDVELWATLLRHQATRQEIRQILAQPDGAVVAASDASRHTPSTREPLLSHAMPVRHTL